MGTTKGISARVSSTLSQRDLPLVISHARGTPAIRSRAATIRAMIKELEMATSAALTKVGWFRKACIEGALIIMPIMGGTKIIAKKMTMAER